MTEQGTKVAVRVTGELGMSAIMGDVEAFHRACSVPVLDTAQFPSDARVKLRCELLVEEMREFADAIDTRNLIEVADALADMVYIIVGTALEFGIPLDRVWAEVQRSNMAKVDPTTGRARHREDGKILKPEGWTPPDVAKALSG